MSTDDKKPPQNEKPSKPVRSNAPGSDEFVEPKRFIESILERDVALDGALLSAKERDTAIKRLQAEVEQRNRTQRE